MLQQTTHETWRRRNCKELKAEQQKKNVYFVEKSERMKKQFISSCVMYVLFLLKISSTFSSSSSVLVGVFLYEIFRLIPQIHIYDWLLSFFFSINKARTYFSRTWFWFAIFKQAYKHHRMKKSFEERKLYTSLEVERVWFGLLAFFSIYILYESWVFEKQERLKLSFVGCLLENNWIMLSLTLSLSLMIIIIAWKSAKFFSCLSFNFSLNKKQLQTSFFLN